MAGSLNRLQIFQTKYIEKEDKASQATMKSHNEGAFRTLLNLISRGGKCVVMYPEGERGIGGIVAGNPRTMKIPAIMSAASPKGLLLLPSYVDSTGIWLNRRYQQEMDFFLDHLNRSAATLKFGPGVLWNDIQPSEKEVTEFADRRQEMKKYAVNYLLLERVMKRIAVMAPPELRGPYGNKK